MVHSEYGRLTANSCCCAACRDLGFFGFHLLREIVKLIFANLASEAPHFCSEKVALERIDEQQRFYSNVYEAHLAEESSTADHCKQHLLTPISDGRWKCPCTHGRGDKQPVPVLQTHEDYIRESTGRDAKNSDWASECTICVERETEAKGILHCCQYCGTAVHAGCANSIGRNDWPQPTDPDDVDWVCQSCAEAIAAAQHDTRCSECEKLGFLLKDIENLNQLAAKQNPSGDASKDLEWAKAALKHTRTLLHDFKAHKAGTQNQAGMQRHQFETMAEDEAGKQSDWWGKIGLSRHHTGESQHHQPKHRVPCTDTSHVHSRARVFAGWHWWNVVVLCCPQQISSLSR